MPDKDSLRELSREVATTIMRWEYKVRRGPIERPTDIGDPKEDKSFGLLGYWKRPGTKVWQWDGLCEPGFAEYIQDASEVIERMHKEHQLSCRIVYVSDQQVAVAFYAAAGAQHVLTEKMDVKGWDTSDSIAKAICRAALQAHQTIVGLKAIASR